MLTDLVEVKKEILQDDIALENFAIEAQAAILEEEEKQKRLRELSTFNPSKTHANDCFPMNSIMCVTHTRLHDSI